MAALAIKQEQVIIHEPGLDLLARDDNDAEELVDEEEDEQQHSGPPADTELEKLPRPASSLNCRQARSYLVKLLRAANGGQNPQYGNPASRPPFWPDFYWPWEKITDVHTKPRGMSEPLLYSEMMKLAIQRGYKYYGYDPEQYFDRSIEEKEPSPVERGQPAPILVTQVERQGQPPKLPRPNSRLNCVQARTVLSRLLRYQQAGNNPVYGHPETRPPWWPEDCIRWVDMVDLRGKPPYLPHDKSYTDVLKLAIEQGLRHFGFDAETWVDNTQYSRELAAAQRSRDGVPEDEKTGGPPRLPVPVHKLNCGLARTSLSRLLRYHCGSQNPQYGNDETRPEWWPNDVFEWAHLKNLSHRYDGNLRDSYSNCLRLAILRGYEYYGKDANTWVEDMGEGLPTVPSAKYSVTGGEPAVMEAGEQFFEMEEEDSLLQTAAVKTEPDDLEDGPLVAEPPSIVVSAEETLETSEPASKTASCFKPAVRRPPPALISIRNLDEFGGKKRPAGPFVDSVEGKRACRRRGGVFPPRVSVPGVKWPHGVRPAPCRVDLSLLEVEDAAADADLSCDVLARLAEAEVRAQLFRGLRLGFAEALHTDLDLVFADGDPVPVHRLVLAAHSPWLAAVLAQDEATCLLFPDVSHTDGAILAEALYTGCVKFSRRLPTTLGSIERSLASFQDVGLLKDFTVQLVPRLPLDSVRLYREETRRSVSPAGQEDEDQPKLHKVVVSSQSGVENPQTNGQTKGDESQATLAEPNDDKIETVKTAVSDQPAVKDSCSPEKKCQEPETKQCKAEKSPAQGKKGSANQGITPSSPQSSKPKDRPKEPKDGVAPKDVIPEQETTAKRSPSKRRLKPDKPEQLANSPDFDSLDLEVIRRLSTEENSELVGWLMQHGFLGRGPGLCRHCNSGLELVEEKQEDGLAWDCPKRGPGHSASCSIRQGSVFQYSSESLTWVLQIILCWKNNTSLSQCQQETGASVEKIFFWYEKCSEFFGQI